MPISEARKRANQKYIDKQGEIKVRVSKERKEEIQAHATALNESLNGFIGRAIAEAMERDGNVTSPTSPQEAVGGPQGAKVISLLPPDTLKTAQAAAEAAGEALPEFITRAVSETAERDRMARKED